MTKEEKELLLHGISAALKELKKVDHRFHIRLSGLPFVPSILFGVDDSYGQTCSLTGDGWEFKPDIRASEELKTALTNLQKTANEVSLFGKKEK